MKLVLSAAGLKKWLAPPAEDHEFWDFFPGAFPTKLTPGIDGGTVPKINPGCEFLGNHVVFEKSAPTFELLDP